MDLDIKLKCFVEEEKLFFKTLKTGINWDDDKWLTSNWLFHRGHMHEIIFHTQNRITKDVSTLLLVPEKQPLPYPYIDFVKAVAVNLQRSKNLGYMAVRNYVNECRRLHIVMFNRQEDSPTQLTRWHFEHVIEFLKEIGYKNIYDSAANLKVIADLIDKKTLTDYPIDYNHGLTSIHKYHEYKPVSDILDDNERKGDEKLISYEAMAAYAQCTNNPINDDEEILLRTIDLLIAMGQRGNEVTLLPFDCWVEKSIYDKDGNETKDKNGESIKNIGIRYYAEKGFQSRVHWLAQQDIPFAKRAIERLKVLTHEARQIAKFQEDNPGRLWHFNPDDEVSDDELLEFLGFRSPQNLCLFLIERNNIQPVKVGVNKNRPRIPHVRRSTVQNIFRAGDVENLLIHRLNNHVALKEKVDGKWKIVLKTSEVLPIRFDGAFRFKRTFNTFKILPGRITLKEINYALKGVPKYETIFERRGLTEADGSKIEITSHMPRHWRNTLYELAGMSNVQQALALGRQKLDQNPTYQHTTVVERTQFHREYLTFLSPEEKLNFIHDGVRNKKILGNITDTYHFVKSTQGLDKAESFLKIHGLAIHLTPFGGCTHDFSLSPCQKHLQCYNGCSHLHRTNTPGETERLKEQLELSKQALESMKKDNDGEYGLDKWTADLEKKISNIEKAINLKPDDTPIPVFPDGKPFTIALDQMKTSSVKEE